MTMTIWVDGTPTVLDVLDGTSILDAALGAGIKFPYGCQSGECGVCKCELVSTTGIIEQPYDALALPPKERARGKILACATLIRGNVEIRLGNQDAVTQSPLLCKVTTINRVTSEVVVVHLKTRLSSLLAFRPGQFIRMALPNCTVREYSIASLPGEDSLEFHIRRLRGGAASTYAYEKLSVGDDVIITGPFGNCWYRQEHPGPILAIAGGTGLAPVKSIVRAALADGRDRHISVYFGMRRETNFYDLPFFERLAACHPNFSFVPVVSESECGMTFRTGLVTDAVRQDFSQLIGTKLYMAGPPAMIETGLKLAVELGIANEDCHVDPFVTSTDRAALTRHR